MQLIEHEWFRLCAPKELNGRLFEKFLNYIKENFSTFLLERIVNLQDKNVSSSLLSRPNRFNEDLFQGNTALHYCVTHGHWHFVNLLLDTNVCDVCIQNHAGYTGRNSDEKRTIFTIHSIEFQR